MKKILLFFLVMQFSYHVFAQSEDETAIRNAMNEQVKAWNAGDIDSFMQTYWKSDSLLFIGSTAPVHGWQTTLENYKKNYPDVAAMGKLSFNLINLKPLSPAYYFVIGEWRLERMKGNIGGYFTLLFKKIKGKWAIVVDHSS